MRDEARWSDDAQRYLDGAGPPPDDPRERDQAARLAAALADYAAAVPAAGEPDRCAGHGRHRSAVARRAGRVVALVRRAAALVPMRPALAAAAAVALVALTSVVTLELGRRARGEPPTVAAADAPAGTVLVRFEVEAPDARRVALAGSFNEWSDSSIVFTRGSASGVWAVTVALPPGRYQYLFVIDGERWMPDPAAHAQVEDEFGQENSLLVVGPRGVVRS